MTERPPPIDLDAPELFINRELSQLAFFRRVLAMAGRAETPLLERLRFLTICSTITDEFFEIRVAGQKQRAQLGISPPGPDGLTAAETLRRISGEVRALLKEQYRLLNDEVLPALEAAGVRILKRGTWSKAQRKWVEQYFDDQVAPVLTPVGLDPAHPFPRVINKGLNMFVELEGRDAFGRGSGFAVLHVPRCLPRVIRLPPEVCKDCDDFVLLSSVTHAHVDKIFPGMKVTGCHQFRLTRNADLWVEEEEVEDLLDALQGQLHHRRFGDSVRLEVAHNCPRGHARFLLEQFDLTEDDLYRVDGPVNLHRLGAVYDKVERIDLKYPPFIPSAAPRENLFEMLGRLDLLLYHPYESFTPVVDLVRQAAKDPEVLAIKMTVYRVGDDSPLVDHLETAARAGKEVTAVVELRARFDEAANIGLATRLQEAGAHVVYGVVGYKTHSKMLMVVRREGARIRRYVHLGTGNYHVGTARAYTDFSFMTSREDIGRDVHQLFMQLTALGRAQELEKLYQSPFTLHRMLLDRIEQEAEHARAGKKARIRAKVNSVSDPTIIKALYRASQAGVQVDLIVRGICCLRPGVKGVSENIRVRSIVGRFLEHTRIYSFHNRGKPVVFLASADLMQRNLYRRVETCFPVEDPRLRSRVLDQGLERYLEDNAQAWELQSDGTFRPLTPDQGAPRRAAQEMLLAELAEG